MYLLRSPIVPMDIRDRERSAMEESVPAAGSRMREEIDEQPQVVAAIASELPRVEEAVDRAREAGARFVIYAARGTSDNAAVYGKYLANILAGVPAGLAAPSVTTLYGAEISFHNCLVFGVSQSGKTPDVTEYVGDARRRGAFTIAITNEEESPLAEAAEVVLPTRAGIEEAVPATKTYTSQLAVLALFWSIWSERPDAIETFSSELPAAMEAVLGGEDAVARLASRYRFVERLMVAARGFNYATALEAALKLKETCYLGVNAYSAADLLHGPIAAVEEDLPALAFAYPGPAYQPMLDLVRELRDRDVEVAVVGPGQALEVAGAGIEVPDVVPEVLSPLLTILPAQLLAYYLAREKGIDPDHPRGLSKVTLTR
jgi:glucosamine--fructose-6-phosphate aminotransferase (isomerizing)